MSKMMKESIVIVNQIYARLTCLIIEYTRYQRYKKLANSDTCVYEIKEWVHCQESSQIRSFALVYFFTLHSYARVRAHKSLVLSARRIKGSAILFSTRQPYYRVSAVEAFGRLLALSQKIELLVSRLRPADGRKWASSSSLGMGIFRSRFDVQDDLRDVSPDLRAIWFYHGCESKNKRS